MSTVNQEKKSFPQDSSAKKNPAMPNSGSNPGGGNREWAETTEKAKEAASSIGEMAGHAASAVGAMASHAASDVGALASQAACDVGTMASQAACDVGKRADDLTANAGAGIRGFGDTLAKNAPHSGVLGSASQAVAKSVHDGGEYLEHAKLSGMAEDIATIIKRNPIPAVCIALGLGWLMASRMRN